VVKSEPDNNERLQRSCDSHHLLAVKWHHNTHSLRQRVTWYVRFAAGKWTRRISTFGKRQMLRPKPAIQIEEN
jgi:hypothetical protein